MPTSRSPRRRSPLRRREARARDHHVEFGYDVAKCSLFFTKCAVLEEALPPGVSARRRPTHGRPPSPQPRHALALPPPPPTHGTHHRHRHPTTLAFPGHSPRRRPLPATTRLGQATSPLAFAARPVPSLCLRPSIRCTGRDSEHVQMDPILRFPYVCLHAHQRPPPLGSSRPPCMVCFLGGRRIRSWLGLLRRSGTSLIPRPRTVPALLPSGVSSLAFSPGWRPFSSTAGRARMQVGVSSPVGSLRQAKSGTSLLVRDQLPRAVPPAPRSSRLDMRFIVGVSSPWCGTSPVDDPPTLTQLTPHASRTARSLRQCMPLPNASAGLVEQLATSPIHPTPQRAAQHSEQIEEGEEIRGFRHSMSSIGCVSVGCLCGMSLWAVVVAVVLFV